MSVYRQGWRLLPEWQLPAGWQPGTRVSVLIAARNEAANITDCLRSIAGGSYPAALLEILVVDDFSEDPTAALVRQEAERSPCSIRLLSLKDLSPDQNGLISGKKAAIEAGVALAAGELIVTTDADCIVPPDWLRYLVSVQEQQQPRIICAPVVFHREQNLLQRFQSLDLLGLMGIGGAGIRLGFQRMGNGANLAYPKTVFAAVDGYAGNRQRASGDDMFLIQKVAAKWPDGVFFLKNPEAAVLTEAEPDLRSFFRQRLRWGAKNAALSEWPLRLVLLLVFLFCWSILLHGVFALAGAAAFSPRLFLVQLAVKAGFDFFFLREMCRYFHRTDLLRWFFPAFLLHTLYLPLIGTAGLLGKKYEWKGRTHE